MSTPTSANDSSVAQPSDLRVAATAVAGLTAVWVLFRLWTGIQLEDALITYRYACNLAHGLGFVFSPGERVLGTTTPLLTLLLGLAGWLAGCASIPLVADLVLIPLEAAALLLTFAALRRLGVERRTALLALVLLGLHPLLLWTTTGGMETPLVLFLMALAFHAVAADRPWLAAVGCGLLVLARPDGVLWCAVVGGVFLIRAVKSGTARRLLGPAGLAIVLVLPWLIFATLYFGSALPHSVVAKRAIVTHLPVKGVHVLDRPGWFLGSVFLEYPFFDRHFSVGELALWLAASLAWLAAIGVALGALRRRELDPRLWALAAFWLLDVLFLLLGRAPQGFDWYLAPLLWASLVLGAVGASWAWRRVGGSRARRAALLALTVFVIGVFAEELVRVWPRERAQQEEENGLRRPAGVWLRNHLPKDASIAAEAIGYLGYYSRRRVIDLAGLVSPEVVRIRLASASNGEAFERILRELRPDAIVLRAFEVERNRHFHGGKLFETPEARQYFHRHYLLAARFRGPHPEIWGELGELAIFRRVAVAGED